MRFEIALRDFPNKSDVNGALAVLRSGAQREFSRNVGLERHLHKRTWLAFFTALADYMRTTTAVTPDDIARTANKCFASLLRPSPLPGLTIPNVEPVGPSFKGVASYLFGRIVPFSRLAQWAKTGGGSNLPKDPADLEDLLEDLCTPAGFVLATHVLSELPLGIFLMWSTFHESDPHGDPLAGDPIEILIARLGKEKEMLAAEFGVPLPSGSVRVDFALLRYRLPPNVVPRVPTIVEGYADGMAYYFRVSEFKPELTPDRLPRTQPTGRAGDHRGLPEIVHSLVTAAQLAGPIEAKMVI
jgi:hypothetical protein